MEPKDLKNSKEELSGAPVEPETINDQIVAEETVEQSEVIEVAEVENAVEEVAEESAPETVESAVQEVVEETAPEVESVVEVTEELSTPEVIEESVAEPVLEEIPSIEELIDISEEDLELHEDHVLDESSPIIKAADYANLSEVDLINELRNLLQNEDFDSIKDDVDAIKINFFRRYRANIEAQKAAFAEAGGNLEEFKAEPDPYELDLRNLLKQYQDIRSEHNKKIDETKEVNLQKKYEIIEEIKALINNKESINKTFHDFRDLQNRWREIGLVPQAKLKDLWDTYHHHVENFYDFIKINKELRDLDLKKNLETKMEICEKSEELLVEPSIIKAFNILQKYHEQWREVGPVPRDKKDELWERFKAATSIINKKHQDYFEDRKSDQKKNLDAKVALCEKVEEIANGEIDAHRDWDERSKELIELQKVWRTIGFAPKKDNNKIYERFRIASDKFFDRKREFYNQNKEEQQNNLQLKTDLCVQAEALKDSTDWKKTADEFINIQKAWKEIGPVPRKFSDVIWKRFRAACDYFFENKAKHFSSIDGEQAENLRLKRELLEEVKQFALSGDDGADLDKLKDFQRRFTDIGHVPFRDKDAIQNEFRDVINRHFDTLRIDEKRRNLMKFKNKVANNVSSGKGQNKNRFEREKYMTKLKQMETDLALLDNNIGFFANTKNASALIEDVNQKIASTKEKIEFLKEKIRIMDAMEDDE
ncbi:MAG: DUF349 domain-containing protein [Prolixibacteraceae bacterium]|nr:DUF349 domain-containing protein [Prolixibacteraceae bacterium]